MANMHNRNSSHFIKKSLNFKWWHNIIADCINIFSHTDIVPSIMMFWLVYISIMTSVERRLLSPVKSPATFQLSHFAAINLAVGEKYREIDGKKKARGITHISRVRIMDVKF
jgi:hypothetical protein